VTFDNEATSFICNVMLCLYSLLTERGDQCEEEERTSPFQMQLSDQPEPDDLNNDICVQFVSLI